MPMASDLEGVARRLSRMPELLVGLGMTWGLCMKRRGFSKELIRLESVEGENPNLVSYDFWRPGAAETPCRAFLARTMFIAAPNDGIRKTRHENNQSCLPPLAAPPRSRRESLLDLA